MRSVPRRRLGAILLHGAEVAEGVSTLEAAAAKVEAGATVDPGGLGRAWPPSSPAPTGATTAARMVLPWVEKALIAAEPLALAHVIAESLDTKAGMMADQGRLQEALALMRGAVRYAEAHGQFEAEMRARNNLMFIDIDDPASSLEVVLEGLETAKRIGLLDWQRQLVAVSWAPSAILEATSSAAWRTLSVRGRGGPARYVRLRGEMSRRRLRLER